MSETQIKVLGVNQDRDVCDCCGKTNLAKVVWLEIDGAEPVAYGVNCAAKAIWNRPSRREDAMTFRRMSRPSLAKRPCVQPASLLETRLQAA